MPRKDKPEKPLVNHRWNLPTLGTMLDAMLPRWATGEHPDFSGPDGYEKLRSGFERFGVHLLGQLSFSLEKAAGKGIEQALRLIQDPDYEQTVRRRTKKQIERQRRYEETQRQERERYKRGELTFAERLQAIGQVTYDIQYHEKQLRRLREEQRRLESIKPVTRPAEIAPDEFDDGPGDDEWPDRITFD